MQNNKLTCSGLPLGDHINWSGGKIDDVASNDGVRKGRSDVRLEITLVVSRHRVRQRGLDVVEDTRHSAGSGKSHEAGESDDGELHFDGDDYTSEHSST